VRVDYVADALRYAQGVVAGEIPACKWVKAACQRQLDDLARADRSPLTVAPETAAPETAIAETAIAETAIAETAIAETAIAEADFPYWFDDEAANRVCAYLELLPHVKGRWGGTLIVLEPWQRFEICCVFGWRERATGLRRFRSVYEEVPRKNAKTTKLAGIGLYMLTADGEWGGEVYSGATKKDQARIVFDIAQQMARQQGDFRARWGVRVFTHSVIVEETGSKFVPLSAEGETLDGLNVFCALIDELHAHKTRIVHDVLDSGTGSRAQPLIWKITTAGSNRAGVCYDQRQYLTKILNAVLHRHGGMGYRVEGEATDDERFWGIIYTVDDADDPLDEATWRKANPNYGVSVDPDDLHRMATVAKVQAAALNEFKTKRLNIWINAESAWMNMLQWDACADRSLRLEDFRGERCWLGLDAAFKKDLFAKVRVFVREGHYYAFGRYYMPEALLQQKGFEQVAAWAREGWIRTTPGEVLDIAAVRDELLGSDTPLRATANGAGGGSPSSAGGGSPSSAGAVGGSPSAGSASDGGDIQRFELAEVGFDPAQLTQFAGEMLDEGLPMVEIRPTVLNFSPAMKELEALVAGRRFHHAGDPVLAWAIANVVCHTDAKDNIYPRKEQAAQKIDPAIALIMALARAMVGNATEKSFWEVAA